MSTFFACLLGLSALVLAVNAEPDTCPKENLKFNLPDLDEQVWYLQQYFELFPDDDSKCESYIFKIDKTDNSAKMKSVYTNSTNDVLEYEFPITQTDEGLIFATYPGIGNGTIKLLYQDNDGLVTEDEDTVDGVTYKTKSVLTFEKKVTPEKVLALWKAACVTPINPRDIDQSNC